MKYLALVICIPLFSACTQNESHEIFLEENEKPQSFTINANKDTTVVGAKGTILKFRANSFRTSYDRKVDGQIQIELKEFYSKEDFIKNRLSTNTVDGRILISSGMISIQAKSDTSTLMLENDQPMTIMFPRMEDSRTANLFSGRREYDKEMRWSLLEPTSNDTIVLIKKTRKNFNSGQVDIAVMFEFLIGQDTILLSSENKNDFKSILSRVPMSDTIGTKYQSINYNQLVDPFDYYVFETASLGYLNCDIFINEDLFPFLVRSDLRNSTVAVVLDSLNSVLYPESFNKTNDSFVFLLPKNTPITVIAFMSDSKRHYFGTVKAKSDDNEILIHPLEKSFDIIEKEIKKLGRDSSKTMP